MQTVADQAAIHVGAFMFVNKQEALFTDSLLCLRSATIKNISWLRLGNDNSVDRPKSY